MKRSRGAALERLPESLLHEILLKLDVESLCCAASVCTILRFAVSQALSSFSILDLSGFSPTIRMLDHVLRDNRVLMSLTLDCHWLDDSSITIFANNHLQELVLLKCHLFSSSLFSSIGEQSPNLRLLTLEIVRGAMLEPTDRCEEKFAQMLNGCSHLESLCIKFRGWGRDPAVLESIASLLPKSIKVLQLMPVSDQHAKDLTCNFSIFYPEEPLCFRLQSLSLVLNRITDEVLMSISEHFCLLIKLELEDKPQEEPSLHQDLTNGGLHSLGSCSRLTHLSLMRSREYYSASFKRVNDMGILLLAEGCRNLESVRLRGFSKVTDAGFRSILHSCKNLNKLEIANAFLLSDLTFHDLFDAPCSLVEVRLASCSHLTSDTAENLSICKRMEVLDLRGCKSIADRGLSSVSTLNRLAKLNVSGSDITDSGLSLLGCGNSPIVSLCLRGCKRVTDKGLSFLLLGKGMIRETLTALDLGHMPRISDKGILTISDFGTKITDLCIRNCFHVTDAAMEALASYKKFGKEKQPLRRLDLYHCSGLSVKCLQMLNGSSFRGLRWLGAGRTCLSNHTGLEESLGNRPGLTICLNGCEMGCYGGCIGLCEHEAY